MGRTEGSQRRITGKGWRGKTEEKNDVTHFNKKGGDKAGWKEKGMDLRGIRKEDKE